MADPKRAESQYGSQSADATSSSFEGTAARTRPCSVEDIILKKYSKKLMKDAKEGSSSTKIKSELVKPARENIASQLKDGAGEMHAIGSVPGSISHVKKNSSDELPSVMDTSRKREEKHNIKDRGTHKRPENDNSRVASKSKLHKDEDNSKAINVTLKEGGKEERNEKRSHHKSKNYDEHKESDYHREDKKEPMKGEKERMKDKGLGKSKREERGSHWKYEDQRDDQRKIDKDRVRRRESKRKHEDDRDEKTKMEIDKGDKNKNDAKFHLTDKVDKRQDADYSEKKERWKESSHPSWHKETKSKRRKRSPSPNHKKAKERGRLLSSSPRSQKRHSSYYVKDHDQDRSSHHVSVEKSEKDGMDSEKNGMDSEKNEKDNNRASATQGSHYRRYSGSTSGLGGYSPRRRRSETAVKTPSPPVHLPERKPAWDMTPGGMDSNMVAAMVAAYQASTLQMAASSIAPALATVSLSTSNYQNANMSASQSVPPVSQQVDLVMDTVELTQSTRPARRIVVNNLPSSVSEGELMEFINSALLSKNASHLPGTKPCISCNVNGDKNQAYAEFLTPEDATATLLLDGITLNGNNLKIKRPKDYAEPANGVSEKSLPAVDLISSTVIDSPYKIFIGGIPRSLSSDKVKEIVTAFGQLKAFCFKDDTNETFAFFEYVDQSVTAKACAGLNGMRLGGSFVTVVQATPDANVEVEHMPNYGIPYHAKALMQKPTRILKLKNVLTKEELMQFSQEEIEEISEDVRLECTRFGTVKSVNIVRCNSQGDHIANIQTEKNGNSQSCLPDTSNTENQSDSLKDQDISVEGNKNNGELNDVDLRVKHTLLEENDSGEQQMANKTDVTDTSNNNVIDISAEPAQEMQENSKAAGDYEMSSTAKVPENIVAPQSVHASELGKSLDPEIIVPVARDEREGGGLDPNNVNCQMTVVAENDESESSKDSEFLEEASVFVEFSREEASCLAAHTLNGRLYGARKVIASYIPNIVYQERFPRASHR